MNRSIRSMLLKKVWSHDPQRVLSDQNVLLDHMIQSMLIDHLTATFLQQLTCIQVHITKKNRDQ